MNLFDFFKRKKAFTVVTCAITKTDGVFSAGKDVRDHFDSIEDARAFVDEKLSWPDDPVSITHADIICRKSGMRLHHAYN